MLAVGPQLSAPGQSKGFPSASVMHCALRICIMKLQLAVARNSICFFPHTFNFFFHFFFLDESVLVMVQISHVLPSIDSDKINKQQM